MSKSLKDRSNWAVRIVRMKDSEDDYRFKPAEGLAAMWQLALDAWALKFAASSRIKEGFNAQSRLQRHVIRIVRPQS
jgi:hypothetical protein